MVNQELTNERFSLFQNEFDRFCRLNQSDLPGYNSQDTCLVSAGDQTGWRRFWKETTQTGPSLFWEKDTGLAFKLENASIDIRLPCKKSGVVHEILCRKVVRSINDDVIVLKNLD